MSLEETQVIRLGFTLHQMTLIKLVNTGTKLYSTRLK